MRELGAVLALGMCGALGCRAVVGVDELEFSPAAEAQSANAACAERMPDLQFLGETAVFAANGACYVLVRAPNDWNGAFTECDGVGMHLATLLDGQELSGVSGLLIGRGFEAGWVGGQSKGAEWIWITGEPWMVDVSLWQPNQPSGLGYCLSIGLGAAPDPNMSPEGVGLLFDDMNCNIQMPFLCEMDP